MEMLIFYIVAILLSAYQPNKDQQECKHKSKNGMCYLQIRHPQDCAEFPVSQR